jgi:hypothetical protein
MMDEVVQKLEANGYKFEPDVNDVEKIPDTVRSKSFFISDITINPKQSAYFALRNTSKVKPTVTALQLNFVDLKKSTTIGEYIKDCRTKLLSAIDLDAVNYPSVKLVEVAGSRVLPNNQYYVYAVNVQYTEM